MPKHEVIKARMQQPRLGMRRKGRLGLIARRAEPRSDFKISESRYDKCTPAEKFKTPSSVSPWCMSSRHHHECIVPSCLRFTGKYARSYGYFAANDSSISTPRPGASPGCMNPFSNEYACGNTSPVSGVWRIYS